MLLTGCFQEHTNLYHGLSLTQIFYYGYSLLFTILYNVYSTFTSKDIGQVTWIKPTARFQSLPFVPLNGDNRFK